MGALVVTHEMFDVDAEALQSAYKKAYLWLSSRRRTLWKISDRTNWEELVHAFMEEVYRKVLLPSRGFGRCEHDSKHVEWTLRKLAEQVFRKAMKEAPCGPHLACGGICQIEVEPGIPSEAKTTRAERLVDRQRSQCCSWNPVRTEKCIHA